MTKRRDIDQSAYLAFSQMDPDTGYLLAFSWYDTVRGLESGLSPYSDPVQLIRDANGVITSTITLDVSGFKNLGVDYIVNTVPACSDPKKMMVRVYISRLGWAIDPNTDYPQFRRIQDLPVPTVSGARGAGCSVTVTNSRSEADILTDIAPIYDRTPFPPCAAVGIDQNRVVGGNVPAYSAGQILTTNGSHYIKPIALAGVSPVFGQHLRDREIRIAGEPNTYYIRDAVAPPSQVIPDETFQDAAAWGAASIVPVELVANGGFETGPHTGYNPFSNWTMTAGSNTDSQAVYHAGAHALALIASTPLFIGSIVSDPMTLIPGASYTLKGWVRCDNNLSGLSETTLAVVGTTGPSNDSWSAEISCSVSPSAFALNTLIFTAPANLNPSVALYLNVGYAGASSVFDDISLMLTAPVVDWSIQTEPPLAKYRGHGSTKYISIAIPTTALTATAPNNVYNVTLVVRKCDFLDANDTSQGVWVTLCGAASTKVTTAGTFVLPVTVTSLTDATFRIYAHGPVGCEIDVSAVEFPLAGAGGMQLYIERNGEPYDNGDPDTTHDPVTVNYEIVGYPTRLYYSVVSTAGILQDSIFSGTNYTDLDMPGDEIQGFAIVRGMLMVLGRDRSCFLVQNAGAIDDVPATGSPYPAPQFVRGGTISGRTIALTPDRSAIWLTPHGTIATANGTGIVEHAVSPLVSGYFRNHAQVDARLFVAAHALYHPELQAFVLYLMGSDDPTYGLLGSVSDQPMVDLHARWTSGTVNDTAIGTKTEQSWFTPATSDPAHLETASPGFGPGLFLDLRLKAAFPMAAMRLASTWQGVVDGTDRMGSPQVVIAGGEDGYLYRALAQDAGGLGCPMTRTRFTVAAGSSKTTIPISDTAEGTFFPSIPSPGMLAGLSLTIRYAATGLEETKTITSNSSLVIVVPSLTGTPVTGDTIWISPMQCGVLFTETRYEYGAHVETLAMDVQNRQPADQEFLFGIYTDDTRPSVVLTGTPTLLCPAFTTADLAWGRGAIGVENLVARAFAYELAFRPVGGGLLQIGPIKVEEFVDSRERTRSA